MISTDDSMAASLWRAHLGYASTSCLESKKTAFSLRQPLSSVVTSSPSDDSSNDTSELPYLCTEPVESKSIDCTSLSTLSSMDPNIDNALLMAMLTGDNFATEATGRSVNSGPILYIDPISIKANMVLSAPSPVDSGYGSRPDTPIFDICGGYALDESSWSPVDDTSSISDESSNTHILPEGFSDAKYWNYVTDAKAASPVPQGPVIPRIVLSDEEGRVVEATIDDPFCVFTQSKPTAVDEDADGPYGGLMSLVVPENIKPASPSSHVPPASNPRITAFVSLIQPRTTPSATTSIYHNSHHVPTFVLDYVEEEEEEEQGNVIEECARVESTVFVSGGQGEVSVKPQVDVECTMNVTGMTSEGIECAPKCWAGNVTQDSEYSNGTHSPLADVQLAGSSLPTLVSKGRSEFNTWRFEDGEDDECEECGLFLTEPDNNYSKLFDGFCQLPRKPAMMLGLLKAIAPVPTTHLNTRYHVTVQGRVLQTSHVPCLYSCERGYWSSSDGFSSIACPRDCPAHGGCGACDVDAIFHRSASPSASTTELDGTTFDYQVLAAEVVGLALSERKSSEEDLDDSDLVLHSAEKFRPTQNKDTPPKAGASYDEYMSRFMDDVEISNSGSNDSLKTAPFGKLVGGTLKDMTMPEAVDHLKEGLEKTESAFRAALTAPFRFNSVADRLTQHLKSGDPKAHPPKERRSSNPFRHHRKESSVSGIKTKWSNMLNKFTR
ncbi:hypothetical protein OPQ81_007710 [Rhizoctonia solani]|nr:hypothetical protein OPQ81_007710 [Rhizoctonia solani]